MAKRPEVFPATKGQPVGTGKPIGDIFTRAEMRRLSKLADERNVTVEVLVRDLVMDALGPEGGCVRP